MFPVLFKIGPVTIYTYGVMVFLAITAGYFFSSRQAVKAGLDKKVFADILFFSIIFGFIGARVFYILVELERFMRDPVNIGFGRAGFVFFGGIISGLAAAYLLTKKYRVDFLSFAEPVIIGVPLAHAIGRIGCFCYGCCYGRPTDSWIGVKFPPASPAGVMGARLIPVQLISSFFLLLIFLALILLRGPLSRVKGGLLASYFLLYGFFRFNIEFFRGDPRGYLGILSVSQVLAMGFFLAGLCILYRSLRRKAE